MVRSYPIAQEILYISLMLLLFSTSCKQTEKNHELADPIRKVRVQPVSILQNRGVVQFTGTVHRVKDRLHRISVKENPCTRGNPVFRVITPTLDREKIPAIFHKLAEGGYLEFSYPPLFLDELQVSVEMGGCLDRHWLLPVSSIWNPTGSHSSVFVMRDGKAIRIGTDEPERFVADRVSVRSEDLLKDDLIIVEGLEGIVNGMSVEVVP